MLPDWRLSIMPKELTNCARIMLDFHQLCYARSSIHYGIMPLWYHWPRWELNILVSKVCCASNYFGENFRFF